MCTHIESREEVEVAPDAELKWGSKVAEGMDNVKAMYIVFLFAAFSIPLVVFFYVCAYCGLANQRQASNNGILYSMQDRDYFQHTHVINPNSTSYKLPPPSPQPPSSPATSPRYPHPHPYDPPLTPPHSSHHLRVVSQLNMIQEIPVRSGRKTPIDIELVPYF